VSLHSVLQRIAGLAAKVSPAPLSEGNGVVVEPEHFDVVAHDVGGRWSCWRAPGESARDHRRRVEVHVQSIIIAAEDDLRLLLGDRTSADA
jgi:hypothetical protein